MQYDAFHAMFWAHGAFWVAVSIIIFAILFGRKIAAPIAAMLDARTNSVRLALEEAARLKAEAEAMLRDATARQAQAMEDAKQILQHARDEAARMSAALAAEAEATAKRREQMALQRIDAAEKSAINDVRTAAIDIATTATTQILRQGINPTIETTMLDTAIAGIPTALRRAV
jgi:F-type H+-transporting ATPase subunit b